MKAIGVTLGATSSAIFCVVGAALVVGSHNVLSGEEMIVSMIAGLGSLLFGGVLFSVTLGYADQTLECQKKSQTGETA